MFRQPDWNTIQNETMGATSHHFGRFPVFGTAPLAVQPKLKINAPGDSFEQEADRLADQVMSMSDPVVQRKCTGCTDEEEGHLQRKPLAEQISSISMSRKPQRKCAKCEEEEEQVLQTKSNGDTAGTTSTVLTDQLQQSKGGGQPLDLRTKSFMESRFGADFSKIKIHTTGSAQRMNREINARAFTLGNNIYFNEGQYQPTSYGGKHLLAHELVHTVQQNQEHSLGSTVFRQEGEVDEDGCERSFQPASTFQELVDLVRAAEAKLIACGYTDIGDRIHVLRGIFYGTTWSNDYAVEASAVRNAGFQTYTASLEPDDPRACLDCNMFAALAGSQDIVDGGRRVDFGHLIIGLDARRSYVARNVSIPTQGGTGLDISTWLGDLGGGAAMTAFRRVGDPTRRAARNFRGTDFGGAINLEGDAAGFLVGRPSGGITGAPELNSGGTSLADWLQNYLEPSGATAGGEWNSRCTHFLQALGGIFSVSGALTNRASIITDLAGKIEAFGCWYLINRLRQSRRLSLPTLRTASNHLAGASEETASIFVDALLHCHSHPGREIRARTDPAPTPVGSSPSGMCAAAIRALELAEETEQLLEQAEDYAGDLKREYWPF